VQSEEARSGKGRTAYGGNPRSEMPEVSMGQVMRPSAAETLFYA
jgi:hypothetical protein